MDNVHEAVKDGHEARVKPEPDAMKDVLEAYEQWEADLIMCDEAWQERSLPCFTQKLWDRFLEIQHMRNRALKREGILR